MKKKIAQFIQYFIFLSLGIFLLWYSVQSLSPENKDQLIQSLKAANYKLVVPVMLIVLLSHFIRAIRWRALIKPLGYTPSLINTFFATILAFFFNLLFPRLGEVMKCTILAKYEKIPADKLIGTMVTERICDVICLLTVIAITVTIQFDLIYNFFNAQILSTLYDTGGNLKIGKIALNLFVLALVLGIIFFVTQKWMPGFSKKLLQLLKGVGTGIGSIRHVKNKGLFVLQSIFIWFLYLVCIQFGYSTMQEVSHLSWPSSFSILSFGSLAMLATQGGIGAYQYTIQKLLALYDIEPGSALAFGWILWIAQIGIVIVSGLLSLLALPIVNKNSR